MVKTPTERRNEELEEAARLREAMDAERKRADDSYATKLVETIVFGALGVVAVAVLGALIALVVRGGAQ